MIWFGHTKIFQLWAELGESRICMPSVLFFLSVTRMYTCPQKQACQSTCLQHTCLGNRPKAIGLSPYGLEDRRLFKRSGCMVVRHVCSSRSSTRRRHMGATGGSTFPLTVEALLRRMGREPVISRWCFSRKRQNPRALRGIFSDQIRPWHQWQILFMLHYNRFISK